MGKNNEEKLDFNLDFLEDNIDTDSTKHEQPIDFMPYMKELQKRIKENWTPPKMSESKSTKILFSVMKNGNIGKISILQSSGDNYFDTCAIETLKMTAPFDPIPDRTRKSVDIQFTFDYNVLDNQNVNTTIEETIPNNTQPFFNKVFIWLKKVWDWILTALGFLLILGIIGSIGFELYDVLSSHIKSKETSITQSKMEQPYNLQEQPIPPSGIIKNYTGKKRIAPFEITPSEHYNYYIKLVDANTGGTALTMFVRSGEKLERKVPLGQYIVKYATGNTWYGESDLFGPETAYSKSDEILDFKIEDNQVSGYTLTLYTVQNGNLHTTQINQNEF